MRSSDASDSDAQGSSDSKRSIRGSYILPTVALTHRILVALTLVFGGMGQLGQILRRSCCGLTNLPSN